MGKIEAPDVATLNKMISCQARLARTSKTWYAAKTRLLHPTPCEGRCRPQAVDPGPPGWSTLAWSPPAAPRGDAGSQDCSAQGASSGSRNILAIRYYSIVWVCWTAVHEMHRPCGCARHEGIMNARVSSSYSLLAKRSTQDLHNSGNLGFQSRTARSWASKQSGILDKK